MSFSVGPIGLVSPGDDDCDNFPLDHGPIRAYIRMTISVGWSDINVATKVTGQNCGCPA